MLSSKEECIECKLICVIANYGMAGKIVRTAKQNGITGATIFFGRGMVNNVILKLLDLDEASKEIIWMLAGKERAKNVMEVLNERFSFYKANHGIVFSFSIQDVLGAGIKVCDTDKKQEGAKSMYKAIFAITEKGSAEAVMDAATKAGARGGTIINARGSGIHETSKVFSMDIEPEKEIVLILAKADIYEAIAVAIKNSMKMELPGNGVIFVQDVENTYGIYE